MINRGQHGEEQQKAAQDTEREEKIWWDGDSELKKDE